MPYMQYPVIKSYYDRLKKNSFEADIDALWNNILGLYFTVAKNYGLEQESRPSAKLKLRADITIRYVKNGVPKKVILIEDRVEYEGQGAVWEEAIEQVTNYLTLVRAEEKSDTTLFAIVTVGRYSRFYQLERGQNVLSLYPGTDGGPLEFKKDENEVEKILLDLVAKTSS